MADKHGDFVWYELLTSDPDAAQAFYGPLLGRDFAPSDTPGMDHRLFGVGGDQIGGLMALDQKLIEERT